MSLGSRSGRVRILFANYRMCFPFFVGGDGLVAHFLLQGGAKFYNWKCKSLGVLDPETFRRTDHEILACLGRLSIPYRLSRAGAMQKQTDGGNLALEYELEGYACLMVQRDRLLTEIRQQIGKFKPHVVITSEENCDAIVEEVQQAKTPVVLLVCHAEWDEADIVAVSRKASCVVFDSKFLLQKYQHLLGCTGKLVYPILDWDQWVVRKVSSRYISMLNPVPEKGGDIFLEVVRAFPQKSFLAQEGWYPPAIPFKNYPNLTWRPRILSNIADSMGMNYFLANTRTLLVPSQWEDALPTIIVHAMKNGIPVIGSHRGGIPEVIGDAGVIIDSFNDPAAWIDALGHLEDCPECHMELSRRAKENSKRFSYHQEMENFREIVDTLVGYRL